MRTAFSPALAALLLSTLAFAPAAQAFDCTPIAVVPNTGTTPFGQTGQDSVPGEVVCGTDYTGWDFHVWEFTIPADALQLLHMASADGGSGNHLLIFNQCAPNECLYSFAGTGSGNMVIQELVCLAAGTYTMVMASSPSVPPLTAYNVGTMSADTCSPVANDELGWGTLKSRF